MSAWLQPLNLGEKLEIGPLEPVHSSNNVPEWVGFLIWAGWWMRKTHVEGTRVFLVMLLPTRICCSELCALGALIGSIGGGREPFTWRKLISLPTGTEVFLSYPDPKTALQSVPLRGELGKTFECQGGMARKVRITSQNKRFKDSTLCLLEGNLKKYALSLIPHPSHQKKKLAAMFRFYKNLVPNMDSAAMLPIFNECMIVTNRAGWKREIEGISVSAGKKSRLPLADLLMLSEQYTIPHSGILLASPKSANVRAENVPLAILDGPEPLRSWEMVRTSNIIVMLDQTEYDESSQNILATLSNARSDQRLPIPKGIAPSPPSGIEIMMFALEYEGS